MFDHRLGLALGKSIGEIHKLSYPEYKSWQLFYSVEPWGWHINELRLGRLLALIFNIFRPKNVSPVRGEDFVSDIKEIISDREAKEEEIEAYEKMPRKEKRAYVVERLKRMFGAFKK